MPIKVAITGNIGSGKSRVGNILLDMGYHVVDTDKMAHEVLDTSAVREAFADYDVFNGRKIDRRKLGKLVFGDAVLKQRLEAIVHPLVFERVDRFCSEHCDEDVVFVEVPLLFEVGAESRFDAVILVCADDALRLDRIMKRDNLTERQAQARMSSQIEQRQKIAKSDYVIFNDCDSSDCTASRVVEILKQIEKGAKLMQRTAIFAASMDPITFGHMAVITEALKGFDRVNVLVATNNDKVYTFSPAERVAITKEAVSVFGDRVSVARLDDGFVERYAHEHGITALVRGVRSLDDWNDEAKIAEFNRKTNPELATFVIFSPKEMELISSSFVKKYVYGPRGWIDEIRHFVPDATVKALCKLYAKRKWSELMVRLKTEDKIGAIDQIINAYSEPSRHYHDIEHIVRGLDDIAEFRDSFQEPADMAVSSDVFDVAMFAWFYHDVAFGAKHESVGASQAERVMKELGLDKDERFAGCVLEAIMATTHKEDGEPALHIAAEIVADADLAIFGKSADVYDRYAEQIRQEYSGYSDAEFAAGRAKVLRAFLERDNLYRTDWFADKYSKTARSNLERELVMLAND